MSHLDSAAAGGAFSYPPKQWRVHQNVVCIYMLDISTVQISDSFHKSKEYHRSMMNDMNGVLGHDSALIRLYWAGDKLG